MATTAILCEFAAATAIDCYITADAQCMYQGLLQSSTKMYSLSRHIILGLIKALRKYDNIWSNFWQSKRDMNCR